MGTNSPPASAFEFKPSVATYSETLYVSSPTNWIHLTQTHLRFLKLTDELRGYAGLRISKDALSRGNTIYNDNHVSAALGLEARWTELPIRLFAEVQYVVPWNPPGTDSALQHPLDFRAGLTIYTLWSGDGDADTLLFLSETYAELFYSRRLFGNGYAHAWHKLGLRWVMPLIVNLDIYVEPSAKVDARNLDGHRGAEARVGIRLSTRKTPLYVGWQLHYGIGLAHGMRSRIDEWRSLLSLFFEV
jgi:hypothetical protein